MDVLKKSEGILSWSWTKEQRDEGTGKMGQIPTSFNILLQNHNVTQLAQLYIRLMGTADMKTFDHIVMSASKLIVDPTQRVWSDCTWNLVQWQATLCCLPQEARRPSQGKTYGSTDSSLPVRLRARVASPSFVPFLCWLRLRHTEFWDWIKPMSILQTPITLPCFASSKRESSKRENMRA